MQASVLLVTLGVILATTSQPTQSKPKDTTHNNVAKTVDLTRYSIGVAMLTVSLFLTGMLGLLQERTYTRYGPCWKEGVFYTVRLPLWTISTASEHKLTVP